jgi:hypothetical protein
MLIKRFGSYGPLLTRHEKGLSVSTMQMHTYRGKSASMDNQAGEGTMSSLERGLLDGEEGVRPERLRWL